MLKPVRIPTSSNEVSHPSDSTELNFRQPTDLLHKMSLQTWQSILRRNDSIDNLCAHLIENVSCRQNLFRELVSTSSIFDKDPVLYAKALQVVMHLEKNFPHEIEQVLLRQFDFRRGNIDLSNVANNLLFNYVESKLVDPGYENRVVLKNRILEYFVDSNCFSSEDLKAHRPWINILALSATAEDLHFIKDNLVNRVRKNYLSGHDHLIEYLFSTKDINNNLQLSSMANDLLQGLSQGKELIKHIKETECSLPVAVSSLNFAIGALLTYSLGIQNLALGFGIMFFSASALNLIYVYFHTKNTHIIDKSHATQHLMDSINTKLAGTINQS